jgi:hypothetical protein
MNKQAVNDIGPGQWGLTSGKFTRDAVAGFAKGSRGRCVAFPPVSPPPLCRLPPAARVPVAAPDAAVDGAVNEIPVGAAQHILEDRHVAGARVEFESIIWKQYIAL